MSKSLLFIIRVMYIYILIKVNDPSKLNSFWHTLKYKAAAVTLGGFESKEEDRLLF